jgi:transketolase
MDMISTRDAFGEALQKLGEVNKSIVVLDADLSTSTRTKKFAQEYPERFFNVGCAEQNLIGTAAGFAISENIPFASTYSIFSHRAWEQIRNIVARDNLNVKIVVTHAGLTSGSDGASHQSLEDIAIMRVIPNMRVIVPADAVETKQVIWDEGSRIGPVYIRLNRVQSPVLFDEHYEYQHGKAVRLADGDDITIIASGTMVAEALSAKKILEDCRIDASVINMHTIKPLDSIEVIKEAKKTGLIITAEEHSVIGGLGSAVAEVIAENYPIRMKMIGIRDSFGESGDYKHLMQIHHLTPVDIAKEAQILLKRKS